MPPETIFLEIMSREELQRLQVRVDRQLAAVWDRDRSKLLATITRKPHRPRPGRKKARPIQ